MTDLNRFAGPLRSHGSTKRLATLSTLLLLLGACASVPEAPNQEIQAAELAIANAEKERVADYASPELREARDKLTAARKAVQDEQMTLAKRLAELSRLNADLASAKADVAKAQIVNDQMQKSIDTLRQEMQRNTGARS